MTMTMVSPFSKDRADFNSGNHVFVSVTVLLALTRSNTWHWVWVDLSKRLGLGTNIVISLILGLYLAQYEDRTIEDTWLFSSPWRWTTSFQLRWIFSSSSSCAPEPSLVGWVFWHCYFSRYAFPFDLLITYPDYFSLSKFLCCFWIWSILISGNIKGENF